MAYEDATKLLRLAIRAAGRVGVTLSDIEEMFECSRRTAQRMTESLCDVFPDAERWIDDDQRPRWRMPPTSVTSFITPTPDELAVLSRAIDKLAADGAANEAKTLKCLEERVLASIPPNKRTRLEVDEEAMLQALGLAARPGPRALSDGAIDDALAAALKGRRCIKMLYRSRTDAKPRWRMVAPHGLLLGTRRYLVARDLKKTTQVLQHYRVEDIAEVSLLSECFEPNEGFDLAVHARGGFGSYINSDEIREVVWRFSSAASDRARRFVFHPDQRVEEGDDGSLTVSFEACGQLEMAWHIYSWGDQVEVLEPPELAAFVNAHRRTDFSALP